MEDNEAQIFYGEITCEGLKVNGKECTNGAYYLCEGKHLCGVHSRKKDRVELSHRSSKEMKELKQREIVYYDDLALSVQNRNLRNNRKGDVILCRIAMMRKIERVEGYTLILPNYRHGGRQDGIGMPELSPMTLGPIDLSKRGLPIVSCIENLHQGAKCFPGETDANGDPLPIYYENRDKIFSDSSPHRHKFTRDHKPLYAIWIDKNGNEKRLNTIQGRGIYCKYYAQLASKTHSFDTLAKMLKEGYNLQICGYDAYPIEDSIKSSYLDPSKPFGHERVLFTMLTQDEKSWPWNSSIYPD